MIGRVVGNYRIVEKLGEGGMGTVFRAVDLMLEREVALKVLRPDLAWQPDVVERFRAEAVILAKLNHPHIATLYSLSRDGDKLFMVMEFVRGETLEKLLAREGSIAPAKAVAWCEQILDALEYAHGKGVVHRDLKPANLMLTEAGLIKITDFGIARALGSPRKTRDGRIIGTIAYMSPEQVRGREVDGRTDIYALGTVLYELVTGHTPFGAEDEFELMTAQINAAPPAPRLDAPEVPGWLEAAILRALAKAPGDRFQTAAEFRGALEAGARTGPALPDRPVGRVSAAAGSAGVAERRVKPTRLAGAGETPPSERQLRATRVAVPPSVPSTAPPLWAAISTALRTLRERLARRKNSG